MSTAAKRQPVAQGGLFSTQKATFSKETQELLKVMMQESKLTNFQQRQLKQQMQSGRPLPTSCNPTSSKPGRPSPKRASSRGKKPPQPSREGLRTRDTIERLGIEEGEARYRPPPGKFYSSKEKSKLQNVMAFGTDTEPPTRPACVQEDDSAEAVMVDRFDEVLQEIEERREFLSEMEALGQGQQHRSGIMTEISQKIRELEVLDKQRCLELQQFDQQ